MITKNEGSMQGQTLNPDRYIREQSRNLPIYKCWINENWEDSHIAKITVARKDGENLAACFYLVDLGCLGVKRSVYSYSSKDELMEQIGHSIDVSYELAHSIIVLAVKYAENLGFYSPEIFTKTTSFFLEEDDKVSLVPVQCGATDGKPILIISLDDDTNEKVRIVKQLIKAVGEGNFHYVLNDFDDDDDDDYDDYYDDDDDDDDDDYDYIDGNDTNVFDPIFGNLENHSDKVLDEFDEDEFDEFDEDEDEEFDKIMLEIDRLSRDEQIELLLNLVGKKDINEDEIQRLHYLSNVLDEGLVDDDVFDDEVQILYDDFTCQVVEIEEYPDSLFAGIKNKDKEAIIELFFETNNAIAEKKNDKKALQKFKKTVNPEAPLNAYFELFYLDVNDKPDFREKLEKYFRQFPDYFLIKLTWYYQACIKDGISENEITFAFEKFRQLLSEHEEISDREYSIFFRHYLIIYLRPADKIQTLTKINAVYEFLEDDDILEDVIKTDIHLLLFGIRINALTEIFSKSDE